MVHGNDVSRAIIGASESLIGGNEGMSAKEDSKASKALSELPPTVGGRRWPVTDLHCYDWWDLFMQFGSYARQHAASEGVNPAILKDTDPQDLQYERWILELMQEKYVKALPRDKDGQGMGRLMDGRAFWSVVDRWPEEGRADRRE